MKTVLAALKCKKDACGFEGVASLLTNCLFEYLKACTVAVDPEEIWPTKLGY